MARIICACRRINIGTNAAFHSWHASDRGIILLSTYVYLCATVRSSNVKVYCPWRSTTSLYSAFTGTPTEPPTLHVRLDSFAAACRMVGTGIGPAIIPEARACRRQKKRSHSRCRVRESLNATKAGFLCALVERADAPGAL